MSKAKIVALYERLSRDDQNLGESFSITNQKILLEWYAKDTSKKIRSTFQAKGKAGKHVASTTPYGYLKDPNDGQRWLVDEEAAEIVRQIFENTQEPIIDEETFYNVQRIRDNVKRYPDGWGADRVL